MEIGLKELVYLDLIAVIGATEVEENTQTIRPHFTLLWQKGVQGYRFCFDIETSGTSHYIPHDLSSIIVCKYHKVLSSWKDVYNQFLTLLECTCTPQSRW